VNTLNPGTDDDVRTPDKLIDGENDEIDGTHCWIAPILPNVVSRIYLKTGKEIDFYLRSIEYLLYLIDRHRYR
jgi:hypothetical protein